MFVRPVFQSLFVLFFSASVLGQGDSTQLLRKNLALAGNDTNRINALILLGRKLSRSDPHQSDSCYTMALDCSQKIKWQRGIARSAYHIGSLQLSSGEYEKAFTSFSLSLLGWEKAQPPRGGLQGAQLLNRLAVCSHLMAEYEKVIEYGGRAIELSRQVGDKDETAVAYGNLGNAYRNLGNYVAALDNFIKALDYFELAGNKEKTAMALGNIGTIYYNQKEAGKALEYYYKALAIDEGLGNKAGITRHLGNIATIFRDMRQTDKALETYNKALAISRETGNKKMISIQLGNISSIYEAKKDYDKAFSYLSEALKLSEEIGDKANLAIWNENLGNIYFKKEDYKSAETYFLQSLHISATIKDLYGVMEVSRDLSKLYFQLKKFDKAFDFHQKYSNAKDSIFNLEKSKDLGRMEAKHEFEKQQAVAKAEYVKGLELANEKQKRQKTISYATGLGLVVVIAFAIIVLNRFRLTQKQKKIIEEQKLLVEHKQKEVLDSIMYARRIQQALIAGEQYIGKTIERLKA